MSIVPEVIVTGTWNEVAGSDPDAVMEIMGALTGRHQDLLAFMTAFTQDLSQEVGELGVYMLVVIYRMFDKHSAGKIRKITHKMIERKHEEIMGVMDILDGAKDKFLERTVEVQMAFQPHVMKYLIETLNEPDEENGVALTDDDVGELFLLLKTCVDLLHEATTEQPA